MFSTPFYHAINKIEEKSYQDYIFKYFNILKKNCNNTTEYDSELKVFLNYITLKTIINDEFHSIFSHSLFLITALTVVG